MEMGIAASITCPTFRPEYAEATVNTTHRKTPHPIERGVSSSRFSEAATGGWYVSPGARGVYALPGSLLGGAAIAIFQPPGLQAKPYANTLVAATLRVAAVSPSPFWANCPGSKISLLLTIR